ncbi:hypothetical protein E4Z66_12010 [Aliishimia ponticola]|uniref:YMGG-like Gly-zipper domain-containing protein n=1 Tax=Aliishimia ponticola TaxID=2499833 RepID=A0A4S4NCN7_9RHOB|nr:hypothetical protein [Aliishimia ponticola]THH35801.1 hypothetical protein E4Z66_12010 [Aliishimia ponticola]
MSIKIPAILSAALLSLAACGDTTGERAIFGAGAGAGAAAVVNANPVTGAAVGAAANLAYCQTYPERC